MPWTWLERVRHTWRVIASVRLEEFTDQLLRNTFFTQQKNKNLRAELFSASAETWYASQTHRVPEICPAYAEQLPHLCGAGAWKRGWIESGKVIPILATFTTKSKAWQFFSPAAMHNAKKSDRHLLQQQKVLDRELQQTNVSPAFHRVFSELPRYR